jgi:hypothetical protein
VITSRAASAKPQVRPLVVGEPGREAGQKPVFKETNMKTLITASLLAASFALPAMAQSTTPATHTSGATTAPATHDTAGNPTSGSYGAASERNSIMTDNGGMRTSKIVGSSVYNDQNQKIGSVDDLVVDNNHSMHAILSVGGFLGMGAKLVDVPFDKLQFGNTKGSSDNRVVLPGTTKDQLTSMPDYHFTKEG